MEKITTFICAIELTFPLNVFLIYLKIIYTKIKFHPSKSLYKKYFPEDKKQTNLQNWAKYEEQHPNSVRAMYQFWVSKKRIDNFQRIKTFNLSEKNDFLRLFYREDDKVTSETLVKLQTSKPLIVGKQYYK